MLGITLPETAGTAGSGALREGSETLSPAHGNTGLQDGPFLRASVSLLLDEGAQPPQDWQGRDAAITSGPGTP